MQDPDHPKKLQRGAKSEVDVRHELDPKPDREAHLSVIAPLKLRSAPDTQSAIEHLHKTSPTLRPAVGRVLWSGIEFLVLRHWQVAPLVADQDHSLL